MKNGRNIVAAFDEDCASRLTGVSKSQLRYWARNEFFSPSHMSERGAFSRVYSFSDIVSLKVLNSLRNQFRVSLQHLRDVKDRLAKTGIEGWSGVKLYVVNKKVVWQDAGTERPQEVASGQFITPVSLDEVMEHTQKDISKLNARDKASLGKIKKKRYVSHSAPVIAGTRIRVSSIKAFSNAGYDVKQIMDEYPDLTEADVNAALTFKDDKAAA